MEKFLYFIFTIIFGYDFFKAILARNIPHIVLVGIFFVIALYLLTRTPKKKID